MRGKENEREARGNGDGRLRVALVLGTIIVFPLLVVAAFFATRSVLPELSSLGFPLPPTNLASGQNGYFDNATLRQVTGQLFPPQAPSAGAWPSLGLPQIDLVGLLLIAAALTVAVILWRSLAARRGPIVPFEGEDVVADDRKKVAAILDQAAASLNAGSSYRETVIQCYRLISELLEERSEVSGRVLTAREFRAMVSEILKIDSPYLGQVTDLFEVARYSEHDVTRGQAQQAIDCLTGLSESLKGIAIPVGGVR